MPFFLNLFLRALLVAAGVVFALALACAFLVLLAAWGVRAAWCKLTGRPVMPFVMRMGPRGAFEEMMRRAQQARQPAESRTPRADAAAGVRGRIGDVTDVEPK